MKIQHREKLAPVALVFGLVLICPSVASAQWNSPNAYGHSTGYGTVYGSYGLAATMQSMYNVARAQSQRTAAAKTGHEALPRPTAKNSASSNPQIAVPPARVVRNHGVFRPDASVDTGKAMADALADTPEEKALIRKIYAAIKTVYEKEAAARAWKNNIAGGLTFFTVTSMTVYRDSEEPSADAADTYYKVLNAALDETPDFASVSNREKQGFNNLMIGFAGILLAGYSEAKQDGNAATLASYKKLAGMLIEMVLKTDPDNLRLEDGQIVMK